MLDLFKLDDDLLKNICRVFGLAFLFLAMLITASIDGVTNLLAASILLFISIIACALCGYVIEYRLEKERFL